MAKEPMGKPEVIAPIKSKAKPEIISPAPSPAPSAISTKAAEEAELVSLKKQIAEIATQTGQKVDPRTGQIIINEAATAKKFGVTPVAFAPVTPVNPAEAAEALRLERETKAQAAADLRDRQSAYDILFNEFSAYGLGGLVEDVKYLLQSDVSPSQFALELKNTKSYNYIQWIVNKNKL